jgi:uncharacterized protein
MRRMAGLLRQGRAPAEIMTDYTAEDRENLAWFAGVGRNDLCPCGSGLKFKRCHGRLNALARQPCQPENHSGS